VQPLTRRFLPVRGPAQAFPLGMLWGWLPCGMVYSVLAMALLTGSATRGAAALLAFGLGTLPNLMLAGLLLVRFRNIAQARAYALLRALWCLPSASMVGNAASLGGGLWQGVSERSASYAQRYPLGRRFRTVSAPCG
jgi:sulfite exporter TauE/SafE